MNSEKDGKKRAKMGEIWPKNKSVGRRSIIEGSVPLPPRSGQFVEWSSGPPLSDTKSSTVFCHIPAAFKAPVTLATP